MVCSQCREGRCRRAAGLQSAPHPAALGAGGCPRSSHSAPHPPTALGAAPYPPALGRGGLPHILSFCLTSSNSSAPHRTALGWGGGAAPHLPILPLILQQLWGLPHILQLWGGGGCPISSHSAPHRTALRWGGGCPISSHSAPHRTALGRGPLPHICQFCLSSSSSSGGLPHILQLCPTSSSSGGGGGLLRNLQFCPISSSSWAGGATPHPPAALGGGRVLPHITPPPPHRHPPALGELHPARSESYGCGSHYGTGLKSGAGAPGWEELGGGQKWGRTPRLCLQSMLSGPQ